MGLTDTGLRSEGSYDAVISRWANVALHKAIENRPRTVESGDSAALSDILDSYGGHDVAFAHVGLSDVNRAFDGDPYVIVRDSLQSAFGSVLAPGFTDYFRATGVYDKQYSRPKHGTFGKLFLDDADYRTNDACRSILVSGDYRFGECDHRHTFATDGCFEKLNRDDVLVVSIGTPWLVCSYLHHLEAKYDVPYVTPRTFEGVMHDDGTRTEITQTTHVEDGMWFFNKLRLHRLLRRHGVLDEYNIRGLRVFAASISAIDDVVAQKLKDDPYYLVTL